MAVYIIAQVIPLLRVMILGQGSKASKRAADVSGIASVREFDTRKTPASGIGSIAEGSVELTQLSSGKIVPVDSEEARAEAAGREASHAPPTLGPLDSEGHASLSPPQEGYRGPAIDDEVHRKWSDMGLSRRAWSKSPSPPTEPATL